ncbi:hypothetical protein PDQ75_27175 [Bacillus cereus group sp. Bc015]|nr:hypothetical protein [Bacillus cereus group sp. Bc015]MDA2738820.1 hypothetical protein [Bacillus cereus group sp. Bc015]
MSRVLGIISGIGMLIAVYLFLNNAKQTTQIIDSIAGNGVKGIKTLQGR